MPSVPAITPQKTPVSRIAARVALVGLDEPTTALLRECFRQFGIDSVEISLDQAIERIHKEKMEACVVCLDENAGNILTTIRKSPSNHRMVIYGICASAQQSLRFSQYGVNAIINDPVERQNALRVVRATHLLVLHELRRYIRIPIVSELRVVHDTVHTRATLQEISGGGLSAETMHSFKIGDPCEVTLNLPKLPTLTLQARVAWVRPEQRLAGFRFEPQEQNRFRIKIWIDEYLDLE
ncbi:MAG TPA: PilZ domain-containing protein [Clostridia bacterium]|nr:PilZ domain-containing protein [Clostridia bacterium]